MIAAELMVPCLSSAANCRLDWVAVAAVGAWAAAIATFFAVLLPFLAGRWKARMQVEAQISDFVPELLRIRATIDRSRAAIEEHLGSNYTPPFEDFQIAVVVPGMEMTRKGEALVRSLRVLQIELSKWNEIARHANNHGAVNTMQADQARNRLLQGLKRLDDAARKLGRQIGASYPHLRASDLE